ncbi:conserved hypothetical protein [Ricinus communis]|uniref:Uncharacterized protein n=1 Tax=Ricinus communis TaxID=3988 RepID=B9SL88_RICCO|nr:conserved hypothetical protein [Ricinus communis]
MVVGGLSGLMMGPFSDVLLVEEEENGLDVQSQANLWKPQNLGRLKAAEDPLVIHPGNSNSVSLAGGKFLRPNSLGEMSASASHALLNKISVVVEGANASLFSDLDPCNIFSMVPFLNPGPFPDTWKIGLSHKAFCNNLNSIGLSVSNASSGNSLMSSPAEEVCNSPIFIDILSFDLKAKYANLDRTDLLTVEQQIEIATHLISKNTNIKGLCASSLEGERTSLRGLSTSLILEEIHEDSVVLGDNVILGSGNVGKLGKSKKWKKLARTLAGGIKHKEEDNLISSSNPKRSKEDVVVIGAQKDISEVAILYFKNLFTTLPPTNFNEVTNGFILRVTEEMNQALTMTISNEAISQVVFSLALDKALGWDDFTVGFFFKNIGMSCKETLALVTYVTKLNYRWSNKVVEKALKDFTEFSSVNEVPPFEDSSMVFKFHAYILRDDEIKVNFHAALDKNNNSGSFGLIATNANNEVIDFYSNRLCASSFLFIMECLALRQAVLWAISKG